jgi:DNA-binding MarR family transcriptional regulator
MRAPCDATDDVRDEITDTRLTSHQASIFDHLDDFHGIPVGELAEHMGVTSSTMSIHIGRLEGFGYVSRAGDRDDGRRVVLRLTPDGARVRDAKTVLDADRVGRLLGRLTADERRDAVRGLELLAAAAVKMMKEES